MAESMGAPLEQRVPRPAAAAPPPGSPRLQMFRALAGKACWRHGGQRAGKARELEAQALSHRRPWQPAQPAAGTFPSSPLAICSQKNPFRASSSLRIQQREQLVWRQKGKPCKRSFVREETHL